MCHTHLTLHVNVTKYQETQRKMSFVIYYLLALADTPPALLGRVRANLGPLRDMPFYTGQKACFGQYSKPLSQLAKTTFTTLVILLGIKILLSALIRELGGDDKRIEALM